MRDHPTVTIRAGVRDLKKASAKFPGVDSKRLSFVEADVKSDGKSDAKSGGDLDLVKALTGVNTLVLVPPQAADNRSGVITAYVEAANKVNSITHIILISAPGVVDRTLSLTRDMAVAEDSIKASGIPYTFLQAVFFYENHFGNVGTLKPIEGSAFYAPVVSGDAPFHLIAVSDIGEATSNAVAQGASKHGNKTYWLSGPSLSHNQQASIIGRVLGKAVKFVGVPDEAAIKALIGLGYPEVAARGFPELYHFFETRNFPENTAPLRSLLTGQRDPTSFESWFKGVAPAFGVSEKPQTVFVAGAAGNTGAATVISLLRSHPTVIVRAGVRDQKKAETKFQAELTGPKGGVSESEVKRRLSYVIQNVSSNGHYSAAGTTEGDAADLKGVDSLVIVPPANFTERSAFGKAYVNAAKAAGVKHIAVITTPSVDNPKLLLTSALAEIEQSVVASGIAYTFLRAGAFYENHFASVDTIKNGAFYGVVSGSFKVGSLAVSDIGEATANVVAFPSLHSNKAYALNASPQSFDSDAVTISAAVGKAVKYVSVPEEGFVKALSGKGVPEVYAKGLAALFLYIESRGAALTSDTDLQSLLNEKRAPTTLAQWFAPRAAAFK